MAFCLEEHIPVYDAMQPRDLGNIGVSKAQQWRDCSSTAPPLSILDLTEKAGVNAIREAGVKGSRAPEGLLGMARMVSDHSPIVAANIASATEPIHPHNYPEGDKH